MPDQKDPTTRKQAGICRKLASGGCPYGTSCHFQHPQQCKRFCEFGLAKYNPKGCRHEKDCKFLHPKTCFSSLKKKECIHQKCHYFHLKGTRIISSQEKREWQEQRHVNESQRENRNWHQQQDFLWVESLVKQQVTALRDKVMKMMREVVTSTLIPPQHQPPWPNQFQVDRAPQC